jgi:hypothetical protein
MNVLTSWRFGVIACLSGVLLLCGSAYVADLRSDARDYLTYLSGCETSLARSTTSKALGRAQRSAGG